MTEHLSNRRRLAGTAVLLAGAIVAVLPMVGRAGPVRSVPLPAVLTGASLTTAVEAGPSVRIGIAAGPALVGRPTELTLHLSASAPAPGAQGKVASTDTARTNVAVTDLLPAGLGYVPGSARLTVPGAKARPVVDPRAVVTPDGTLMVWSSVSVAAGRPATSLLLAVSPTVTSEALPAGRAGPGVTAGSQWTDRAWVYASRAEGAAAPVLSATGTPAPGAAGLVATGRRTVEVVAVAAVQTGRLLPRSSTPATQRLAEHLTVTSTPSGPAGHVTVEVYLPGAVAWAGCGAATACLRPTLASARLPVTATQPDRPLLPPPGAPPSATRPANAPALFTVLTWHFATLAAGSARTVDYRLDAGPIARARTQDVVVASAAFTAKPIVAPSAPPTTATAPPAKTATSAGTAAPASTATPATTAPLATPALTAVESRATVIQLWPVAAPVRAVVIAATTPAAATTTSTAAPTTTTTVGSPPDPFTTTASTAPTTTTVTTAPTATTADPTTTSTMSPAARLASTGSDVAATTEVGLAMAGTGVVLLLSGRVRRRRPSGR